jgi:protein-tyrosine phosphatase
MGRVLFICTGNYYRSRFAEEFFNKWTNRLDLDWEAISRGTICGKAQPHNIHPSVSERLDYVGEHRPPLKLEENDLDEANLIIAMREAEHREYIENSFPDQAKRVEYWDIHDTDVLVPEVALPRISLKVYSLIKQLS